MSTYGEHTEVHITVLYTQTDRKTTYNTSLSRTVLQVVEEAYEKLGEHRRADDQYFCHQEPRVDLTPYLQRTLHALEREGVCLHDNHGKLAFAFDIEAKPG